MAARSVQQVPWYCPIHFKLANWSRPRCQMVLQTAIWPKLVVVWKHQFRLITPSHHVLTVKKITCKKHQKDTCSPWISLSYVHPIPPSSHGSRTVPPATVPVEAAGPSKWPQLDFTAARTKGFSSVLATDGGSQTQLIWLTWKIINNLCIYIYIRMYLYSFVSVFIYVC